ncbi:hypothetical protein BsWGS_28473 [Bradybaena similaris]
MKAGLRSAVLLNPRLAATSSCGLPSISIISHRKTMRKPWTTCMCDERPNTGSLSVAVLFHQCSVEESVQPIL